jgi:Fur family ferric uptake transcriptional regulator
MSEPAPIGREAYGRGRLSAQRETIARAARDLAGAFSADELFAEVRKEAPGIGLATVYRAVAAMESAGFLEAVGLRGSATLYVHCSQSGHHHHVVCTGCGAVAEAECSVNVSAESAEGFAITSHALTLYGLCPRCQP